jgi:hypothetical protein
MECQYLFLKLAFTVGILGIYGIRLHSAYALKRLEMKDEWIQEYQVDIITVI